MEPSTQCFRTGLELVTNLSQVSPTDGRTWPGHSPKARQPPDQSHAEVMYALLFLGHSDNFNWVV